MVSSIGGLQTPNNDFSLDKDLVIKDDSGVERIRLDHETGGVFVRNSSNEIVFQWEMPGNNLRFGGQGKDGDLVIFPRSTTNLRDDQQGTLHFNAQQGTLRLGSGEIPGQLVCLDNQNNQTIFLDGTSGNVTIGANSQNGNLVLQNGDNESTIQMSGENGSISGQKFLLKQAILRLGANGDDGDILLYRGTNTSIEAPSSEEASIHINSGNASISVGGQGVDGEIVLRDGNRQNRVFLGANSQRLEIRDDSGNIISMIGGDANVRLGSNDKSGNAFFYPASATNIFDDSQATIRLDGDGGNIWIGGNGADGDIALFASGGDNVTLDQATIHLNGDSGDIILQNADCAEDFEVEVLEAAEPGTVMVISDGSRLRVSNQAYDRRVAGIIAGAGQYRPGIVLGRNKDAKNSLPIALMGRVSCKADASSSPIQVGDLLTTSSIPGHAMKVTDPEKAFGTVIGKALGELNSGTGMIPILVSLQ